MMNPACCRCAMIRPALPLAMASGLMMARVCFPLMDPFRKSWECDGLEACLDELDHVERPLHDAETGALEGGDLLLGGAGGAGDDRAGVAHPAALGRRLAGNEADLRLGDALPHELGGHLLVGAADLAHEHD